MGRRLRKGGKFILKKKKILIILLSLLFVTPILYHFREVNIKDLVDFDSISSSNSLKVVILKRDTFFGEMVRRKEITDRSECLRFIDDLTNYKFRRTFIRKGSDDVTQYFIGVEANGNKVIRLVVKGDKYIYLRDKRGVFDTYRILKNTYNIELLEALLSKKE